MRRRLPLMIMAVCGVAGISWTQMTAAITGIVKDASGAVIPGVVVTARHLESGLTRIAKSDAGGGYNVPSLPVGQYEVIAEKTGFKTEVRRGVELFVGEEAVVNLALDLGAVDQQVMVTAETPIVNTTLNSTSGLINERQIKDLPLNGRSFDQLLTLNTGAINNSSNVGNGNWTEFSLAGKRMDTNRYLLNGLDWIGTSGTGQFNSPLGVSRQLLGVDAVREFNVLPDTYGAEYGKRAGGQISIVTSSGTNQLHGDVFEYLRNGDLDARNFFDATVGAPPFKRNQFGAAVGGPLKRDRAFLFGTYEGFRQRLAVSSDTLVPDALARQGLLPDASGVYVPVPNLKQGMLPFTRYFWPAPNGPELLVNGLPTGTAHAFSNPAQSIREDFGLMRFDYTVSARDSFWVNHSLNEGHDARPVADPVFVTIDRLRNQSLATQETHVVSPTFLNTATFGWANAFAYSHIVPAAPIPASLSFIAGESAGSLTIGGAANSTVAGSLAGASGSGAYQFKRDYYTWSDDVHLIRGSHSWSGGAWIQVVHNWVLGGPQGTAGTVSYPTLQSLLQDLPTSFVANPNPVPGRFRSTEAAWYIQDEMKVKPNLSLRIGVRDEMTTGWNALNAQCSNYVFDQNGVIQTDPLVRDSCLLHNYARALWQPRVGLAWGPGGRGTWAVRAAFGVHNDLQDIIAGRSYNNPPLNTKLTLPTAGGILSEIPILKNTPIPHSCHNAPVETNCSIFQPAGLDPDMHTPTIQQWSLSIERAITKDVSLLAGYAGMQSYHISLTEDVNVPRPQVCASPQVCLSGGVGSARATVPQGTTYIPPGLRPNPNVGPTQGFYYLGTASYHALDASLTRRSKSGLTLKVNYTFAKVLDLNSAILTGNATNEPVTILDPYNLRLNKGVASYNVQSQFNANFSYPLPFGRRGSAGLMRKLIGDWQWNTIVIAQKGFPFTPMAGANVSGSGDTIATPDVANRNPAFIGPVILGHVNQWFDPKAFSLPAAGTFGNVARGSFAGPGLVGVDTSLVKKFRVAEGYSMQFRAEAFNVANHANFGAPNPVVFSGSAISPSAGVITLTSTTSRQIQFALKLLF